MPAFTLTFPVYVVNFSQALTHINLKFRDMHGNELHFKLKQTTVMKKAMTAYATRTQRERHTLRFVNPDGERVLDDQTPEMVSTV
jgi:hypothetical protein